MAAWLLLLAPRLPTFVRIGACAVWRCNEVDEWRWYCRWIAAGVEPHDVDLRGAKRVYSTEQHGAGLPVQVLRHFRAYQLAHLFNLHSAHLVALNW